MAVALAATVVLVAGGYGYAHWRFGQIASIDLPGLTKPPKPGGPQVVLVVGSDSRAELDQPGDAARFGTTQDAGGVRADVIMLVRVDPAAHTVKILSIPRDLLVPLGQTGRRGKVNAAFAGGPAQLVQTIQAQLGIPIHHYLLVNFDGFRAIVDALGGINLNFPYPARDALAGLRICGSPAPAASTWTAGRPWRSPAPATTATSKAAAGTPTPSATLAASSASRPSCGWCSRPRSPRG